MLWVGCVDESLNDGQNARRDDESSLFLIPCSIVFYC